MALKIKITPVTSQHELMIIHLLIIFTIESEGEREREREREQNFTMNEVEGTRSQPNALMRVTAVSQ